jgi:hypothetical protein
MLENQVGKPHGEGAIAEVYPILVVPVRLVAYSEVLLVNVSTSLIMTCGIS